MPERLNIPDFAQAGARLEGVQPLGSFSRLAGEAVDSIHGQSVEWDAEGEQRQDAGGRAEAWMHLHAGTRIPLTCQRCLTPVVTPLEVDRWFRFAPNEEAAAALDEELEDDVLVSARDFDLLALIEDELLMDLPITPRHDVCPQPVQLSAQDAGFDTAEKDKESPFAALSKLRPTEPQ